MFKMVNKGEEQKLENNIKNYLMNFIHLTINIASVAVGIS